MVVVVAGLLVLATAIALVVGGALLVPGSLLKWLARFNRPAMEGFEKLDRWSGALMLLLACFTAVGAIGLLRAKKWGWWTAVGSFAVNGCGDVIGYAVTRDAWRSGMGVVICAAFLYALVRTRRRFQ